ncbi:MAG TPA: sugar phosphate nucleotidyltransferase [Candidatus Angelobacter sp.]|jgi:NDP-sugar pyrophosphorylase family protein|nr:sugar phosphate nucleotidyltransferase [Candidatus Angelobacter sp.]
MKSMSLKAMGFKGMVLAAGLGTRLQPLTNDRPKALVEVSGRTMLEITLSRLRAFGIQDVIINIHHYADLVMERVKAANNFGMNIEFSREDILLDTGGGLKQAAWFLSDNGKSDAPFILHNVDIISSVDLQKMLQFHTEHKALATLAVQDRKTSRYLLFDDQLQLCGRRTVSEEKIEMVRDANQTSEVAFTGIHIISPRIFPLLTEEGVFSIIPAYLRLAALGEKIMAFRADEYYWRDLGKPENIQQAEQDIKNKLVS